VRALLVLVLAMIGCSRAAPAPTVVVAASVERSVPALDASALDTGAPDPPVEVKTVDVPGDVPVFHLAGKTGKRLVFLHPMCTHGLGYLQAFQFAAHERASAIALQGEKSCGGAYRQWSFDFALTDARIEAAWKAVGDGRPIEDLMLVGYSQGVSVAVALAERFPDRYTRVVLIGGPREPVITKPKCAVMVSAEKDAWWLMKQGSDRAARAGIPSTFITISGARHGQMGDAEDWMKRALDFCSF
jgi:alpha-beta hydrolase superfamily lysophospholipase